MYDDDHYGSEDYPLPTPTNDDFRKWGNELGTWGAPWNGWDTFLRRLLMAGCAAMAWIAVGAIIVIAIKM